MWTEFKAFLLRGDVLTLAIAVIIAGAFSKIIDSMVADVIMPVIGMIGGVPDFSDLVIGGKTVTAPDGTTAVEGGIKVGNFMNAVINFVIIGFVLFGLIKVSRRNSTEIS